MSRFVPFQNSYKQIRIVEGISFYSLVLSSVLIFIKWGLDYCPPLRLSEIKNFLNEPLEVLSYVSISVYILCDFVARVWFSNVERHKRQDLIDNSFGTKYSDENSTGYYNNLETDVGIKKLALNTYESAFHTENTLKHMIKKNLVNLVLFGLPFLLSIFTKNGNYFVRLLFEISIPLLLAKDFVIMCIYQHYVSLVNERFKTELTNIGNKDIEQNDIAKLLIPVLEYHSLKAWANFNLDPKIFHKYNSDISDEWLKRKQKLDL